MVCEIGELSKIFKAFVVLEIYEGFLFVLTQRKIDQRIYETRASLLRKYQPPIDNPPLWQMPRFAKVCRKIFFFGSIRQPEM